MKMVQLIEIAQILKTGKTPPSKSKEYFNGDVNWFTPGDLNGQKTLENSQRTLSTLALTSKKAIAFPKNTVFISCIGDIGKTGISSDISSCNQQLTGILPNEHCLPTFLYYWIKGNKHVLEAKSNNAVVPILNNKALKKIRIPLPPLPTQKKIAAILDAADAYRQKTKALVDKYDELAQSLFLDMFGDPVRNEKGWEMKPLDEVVSEDCPLAYGIVQPGDETEEGVPVVRPVDLVKHIITPDELKKIDKSISEKFKRTFLRGGEILLSVRGSVGLCAMADEALHGANVTRGIVPIWMNENHMKNEFAFALFNTRRIQDLMMSQSRGVTLIQLNLKDLRKIPIIVPDISEQLSFVEKIKLIRNQITMTEREIRKTEDLFNSLLQRAFKGEL